LKKFSIESVRSCKRFPDILKTFHHKSKPQIGCVIGCFACNSDYSVTRFKKLLNCMEGLCDDILCDLCSYTHKK